MSIKFEDLKLGQKIWLDGKELIIWDKAESLRGINIYKEIKLSNGLSYSISEINSETSTFSLTPPKKKVTKEIIRWVNVYPDFISDTYVDKDSPDRIMRSDRIACVKLTGTYEVEE